MAQSCPLPFASKSVTEHVLRGVLGVMAIVIAIKLSYTNPIASMGLGILALLSFRGCPMCWVAGMIVTIQQRFKH
jgi:hypothetical protein